MRVRRCQRIFRAVMTSSSLCRSRRRWLPNVQGKSLYSEILDRTINLKVTTHALRCIDKAGGVKPLIASSIRLHGLLKIVRRRILRERHALDEGSLLHAGLDKYILNTREDKLYSDKGIMLKMEMLVKLSGRGGETEDAVTPAMSSPAT